VAVLDSELGRGNRAARLRRILTGRLNTTSGECGGDQAASADIGESPRKAARLAMRQVADKRLSTTDRGGWIGKYEFSVRQKRQK